MSKIYENPFLPFEKLNFAVSTENSVLKGHLTTITIKFITIKHQGPIQLCILLLSRVYLKIHSSPPAPLR